MLKITKEMIKTTPFLRESHLDGYLDVDGSVYRVMDDGTVQKYSFIGGGGWSSNNIPEKLCRFLRWCHNGRIS